MTIKELLWEVVVFVYNVFFTVSESIYNVYSKNFFDLKIFDIGVMIFLLAAITYIIFREYDEEEYDEEIGINPNWSKKSIFITSVGLSIACLCVLVFLSQYFHPAIADLGPAFGG